MSISSFPLKTSNQPTSLFPFSRNSSLEENYPIKKRKSPLNSGVFVEKPLKKTHLAEADATNCEKKRENTRNLSFANVSEARESKKELKIYEKFLNKLKQQRKQEFISLDSCIKNNKLSFLPYIRCADSFYMIVPVLPKALCDLNEEKPGLL